MLVPTFALTGLPASCELAVLADHAQTGEFDTACPYPARLMQVVMLALAMLMLGPATDSQEIGREEPGCAVPNKTSSA